MYVFLGIFYFHIIFLIKHILQLMCSQNIYHNPTKIQTADWGA